MPKLSWKGEEGQVLVLLPAVLIVLLALAGGVVDLGSAYYTQTRLQSALDAGALAAAQDLAHGKGSPTALADANQLVHANGFPDITFSASDTTSSNQITMNPPYANNLNGTNHHKDMWVELKAKVNSPTYFMRIFGRANIGVPAASKAATRVVNSITGVVPIGVPDQQFSYGQQVTLSNDGGDGPGNYGFLSFSKSGDGESEDDNEGASALEHEIEDGYNHDLSVGDWVLTKPGKNTGPVKDAVEARLSKEAPESCSSFDTASWNCPQVMYLPVVDFAGANGRSSVQILGFAAFYLEGIVGSGGNQQIEGRFIKMIHPGDTSQNLSSGYGMINVQLVNP